MVGGENEESVGVSTRPGNGEIAATVPDVEEGEAKD